MLENILTDNQRTCNIICVPGWTDEQRDSDMARGIGGIERDEKVFRIESDIARRHWHYLSQQTRCCSAHGRRAALQCSRPPGCSRAEVVLQAFRLICLCYAASCDASLCIQSSVSSHMPLPVSKLRSVTVGKDDVITSSASNLCRRG